MSITVSGLSKFYGKQTAVNDISFTVQKGEIVGFLGPNGAGKSTTLKMITGYLASDRGKIDVCGISVEENNVASRKMIGYLPEANPLYADMYVREYLNFIANIHEIRNREEAIEEVIKTVGLGLEAHKKTGQLSKGYKQRVGLAAALVHDPEVLILDEPTSGLDPNQIVEIRNVIKSLALTKTILFSSHIMQEVEAICDRVIIINKGNIVADARPADLQKEGIDQDIIIVEFKENIAPSLLETIEGVILVTKSVPSTFNIHCRNAEVVKKHILRLSVDMNLNIISMHTQAHSLEAVFKALTT